MSNKSQNSRKNMLLSMNMTQLTNAVRNNREQKSLSKMIQNFENLFHQELVKIKRADKVFIMWEKLKYIVFMCILNIIVRQIIMMKAQNVILSYAEILKIRLNSTVKAVFKRIKHKIIILWCECLSLNKEEIKSAKIMKTVNTKIEDNNKEKMIITRKFLSKDIMLILNLIKTKNLMMKETN